MKGLSWAGMSLALLLAGASARADGGFVSEDAARRMVLPEGFQAQVFASEPAIRQPVAACFDERGRLWVIEYLQYPVPAGLKPVTVDQYLRTEYDRIPDPPPRGPRGADRIKILEDTDGDGRADKVTVFVEGLNLASAIAVGHGGVYVGQAPYLLFYPDADRDDRPDRDPDVLLTGFGLQDAHATLNSLAWGPDGWLYGAQGSTVTARIQGIEFQQGIWRFHPRSHRFELFAEGGGNTWGLDFDRAGHAFGSSNGGFITFHMEQGGNYWKGFAKHGPLHNPRTYGYFDSVPYEGERRGGHVTPGGIIYKGDSFPEPFRGTFIGGNLLSNAVYWHELSPSGSSFRGRHGGTLIDARDPWFRPIDLLTGPEGALYVVDWYDRRASHLDPRDNWDKTNGRIYRITYGEPPRLPPFDLAQRNSDELVDLRERENDWWPDMARRLLAERRDPRVVPRLSGLLAADRDEPRALRDLWALNASGGLDDAMALGLLDHPVAGVRRWTVRLLGDEARDTPELRSKLIERATNEPDPATRVQLAASCQRWSAPMALAILERLLSHDEDAADPHAPLMLWWAIERQMRSDRRATLALFLRPEAQSRPLVGGVLLERAARALAAGGSTAEWEDAAQLLGASPAPATAARVVAGLEKGLEGRRLVEVPEGFRAVLSRLREKDPEEPVALRLAYRLGDSDARQRVSDQVRDAARPVIERLALVEMIGQVPSHEGEQALQALLDRKDEAPAMLSAAITALAATNRPELADALLSRYPQWPVELRRRVVDVLASRKVTAQRLLTAIESGLVPAKEVQPAQALQVVQLQDETLNRRLEVAWGRVPVANSEAKRQRIAEVRGMLPEGDKGSPARGRATFQKHCGGCHRLFGEGDAIGPDLTGTERGNLEFLLASVVDPSALVRKEFEAQTLALSDGRVLTGLVLEENAAALTLIDGQRQKTLVPTAEIEQRRPASLSLMPDGLLDPLPENEIRDLFRYLQSNGPPAP